MGLQLIAAFSHDCACYSLCRFDDVVGWEETPMIRSQGTVFAVGRQHSMSRPAAVLQAFTNRVDRARPQLAKRPAAAVGGRVGEGWVGHVG